MAFASQTNSYSALWRFAKRSLSSILNRGGKQFYIDDPSANFTPDELARITDAVSGWDALLVPYNVTITQVADASLANLFVDTGTTSASGSSADGVLGCYDGVAGEITILQGWNWYAGANPAQIGQGQYDFQTTVTHEFGHALGLGHSADANSPMFESLAPGQVRRVMTVADLNIPDPPTGADPLTASPWTSKRVADPATGPNNLRGSPAGFTTTLALTVTREPAPVLAAPLFVGLSRGDSNPPSLLAPRITPACHAIDAESWLGLEGFWAGFGDQPTRAIPALEQISPEEIPLILENSEIFKVESADHDPKFYPHEAQTQPTAVQDQVFAQMATDMDYFGEWSE